MPAQSTAPSSFFCTSSPATSKRSVFLPARQTGRTKSSGGPEKIPPLEVEGGM